MRKRAVKNEAVLTLVANDGSAGVEAGAVEDSARISDLPLWLTVPMVARQLSLGKTKIYDLIDLAGLPVVRVGRAVRIPTIRFLKWVEEFEKQGLSA